MAPLIGITTYEKSERERFELPATYVEAVRLVGGIPVLIPPGETNLEALLARLDGLILAGGDDVNPAYYGGANHPKIHNISVERDEMEIALSRMVVEQQFPTLCICRGAQVLNVALGGTLIEHIPDEAHPTVHHQSVYDGEVRLTQRHTIEVNPDSQLARLMDATELQLPSYHHQAIRKVAPSLRMVARAEDGIIEGVEHPDHPFLVGVQWHPEKSTDVSSQLRLFEALVQKASEK
jgi:putative glutamine amidotransferase